MHNKTFLPSKKKHEVELQFLGTALPNIATNKHTKFQVIPPKMTQSYSGHPRNGIKMKVKWGKNSKICARKLWFLCNALHNCSKIMHTKI